MNWIAAFWLLMAAISLVGVCVQIKHIHAIKRSMKEDARHIEAIRAAITKDKQ